MEIPQVCHRLSIGIPVANLFWCRLSGYLLFPFFLATIAVGGGWSSWTTHSLSKITRIFTYGIAPIVCDH